MPRDQSAISVHRGTLGYTGVVLRFSAFYGPDAMQMRSYIDGLRWGWALLPGGPDRFVSSISHDDAASAVVAALEAPAGIYNATDDSPVRRSIRNISPQPRLEAASLFAAMGNTAVRVCGAGHVPIASALQCQAEKGDSLDTHVPQCARGLAGDAYRNGLWTRSALPLTWP